MDLRMFNHRFLMELNRYRRDLKHLGTGSEEHPLLRSVLLSNVKIDLTTDGFDATLERWHRFIGMPEPEPLNLPPSPVYGLQLDFEGRAREGRQIRIPLEI